MPINAGYEYANAEAKYLAAQIDEDRIIALEEMLRVMPKHKGSETLRANLNTRYKKLKGKLEKERKSKKGKGKRGIRKEALQAILLGLTNSGKSSLLSKITNANPVIASYGFSTQEPEVGTLNYGGCKIQIVDLPPIGSQSFDNGIVSTTDTVLVVVEKMHEIEPVMEKIINKELKKIIVFNKIDTYEENVKRKISESLRSKKYNFVLVSCKTGEGLDELKDKIFKSFEVIRIYTQQPSKKADEVPVVLNPGSTLGEVAEKILHGYSKRIKFAKIWGPSSKFGGQKIGLKHIVKDKDIVEFYTE